MLLEWCRKRELRIYVSGYIVEELSRVLGIEKQRTIDFLRQSHVEVLPDNYYTQYPRYKEFIKESRRLSDLADRPIFIFAKVFLAENLQGFFITGDKGFFKFESELFHRVKTARGFLELI